MDQRTQAAKIQDFLTQVFQPGDLMEIRGLNSDQGTLRLLTNDFALAARTAISMESHGADVYFCLNPLNPESKYATTQTINYPARRCTTGGDKDISCRNLYLIDIDPVRPSGTAATKEQRASALATAQAVHTYLTDRGWPEPIVLDSGNGYHMLFRGNRCSADDTELRIALKALNNRFSGSCKIDTVVSNPARISRLPYTINRKADRRSKVVSLPDRFDPLIPGLVYQLAVDEGGYSPSSLRRKQASKGTCLLDEDGVLDLIAEFPDHLQMSGEPTYREDATYFALDICPFKGEAHRGQGVGMGKTTIILRPDGIGFKCFSDDCAEHTIGSLLHLLHDETGRWPSMQIWDEPDLDHRWGYVEDIQSGVTRPLDELLQIQDANPTNYYLHMSRAELHVIFCNLIA